MDEKKFLAYILAFEFPLHTQATFNPSVFTIEKFATQKDDIKSIDKGLLTALALNILFSFGLYKIDRKAGFFAFLVSIAIFLYFKIFVVKR